MKSDRSKPKAIKVNDTIKYSLEISKTILKNILKPTWLFFQLNFSTLFGTKIYLELKRS